VATRLGAELPSAALELKVRSGAWHSLVAIFLR
jgi:hypothetical protein